MGLGRWLFVCCAGLYLVLGSARISTPDGVLMARVSASVVSRRALDVAPLEMSPEWGGLWVEGAGGRRFYPKYGPGLSLAAVPMTALGRWLAGIATAGDGVAVAAPATHRAFYGDGEALVAYFAACTSALVCAGVVALLALLVLELGFSRRTAIVTALALAFGTPLLAYSATCFAEPLGALGLQAAALFALRGAPARAGLALGVAVLARPALVVVAPLALPLLLERSPSRSASLAWSGIGLGAMLGGLALYNAVRFGSPLETGYGDEVTAFSGAPLEGLAGLLMSPGRGLFVYCPLAAAGLLGLGALRRRSLGIALLAGGSLAALLALHCRWYMWEGGWCWGPRFLLPALPLVLLGLAPLVEGARGGSRPWLVAVACLSLVIAVSGRLVDFNDFHLQLEGLAKEGVTGFDLWRWSVPHAPLVAYWGSALPSGLLLPRTLAHPGVLTVWLAIWAAAAALGASRLVRALRAG